MLKESGLRSSASSRQKHSQALLVTAEMALAMVLVIGAAVLIRSFLAIRRVNPGFNPDNVLSMRMLLAGPDFESPARANQVIREGIRRIRALPEVEGVAASCCVPLETPMQTGIRIAGHPEGRAFRGVAVWTLASPDYFEVLKIPVLRGRTFTERDEGGPPVAIINEALAKQFFPDSNPLNERIIIGNQSPPRQIIGIVGDVHDSSLDRASHPNVYEPLTDPRGLAWLIRTRDAGQSARSAIQNQLRMASGGLPVGEVRTLKELLSRSMATDTFRTMVLTIFACSALILAAIGIYGLMAYSVAERVHEVGIRLALGAESANIRRLLIFQGMRPALAGVALGLPAAFGFTRGLASFLFDVKPWDPLVFSVIPIMLIGVALAAVSLPAIHASRIDPTRALRNE